MKASKYQKRFYREWVNAKDLHLAHIIEKETDLEILTDKPIDRHFVEGRLKLYRRNVEDYINKDRRFLTALKPLAVELGARPIVRSMSWAAKEANVGPMAAVAGAIAEFLGRDLLRKGYKEVIIENGGDIFLKITKARKVAIFAGKKNIWSNVCLRLKPKDTPLGVCCSSGTIGHSLSFGKADSVVILSKSACLADAVATATANLIKSKEDLRKAFDFTKAIKGIAGAVIIIKSSLMSWGKCELVTAGS